MLPNIQPHTLFLQSTKPVSSGRCMVAVSCCGPDTTSAILISTTSAKHSGSRAYHADVLPLLTGACLDGHVTDDFVFVVRDVRTAEDTAARLELDAARRQVRVVVLVWFWFRCLLHLLSRRLLFLAPVLGVRAVHGFLFDLFESQARVTGRPPQSDLGQVSQVSGDEHRLASARLNVLRRDGARLCDVADGVALEAAAPVVRLHLLRLAADARDGLRRVVSVVELLNRRTPYRSTRGAVAALQHLLEQPVGVQERVVAARVVAVLPRMPRLLVALVALPVVVLVTLAEARVARRFRHLTESERQQRVRSALVDDAARVPRPRQCELLSQTLKVVVVHRLTRPRRRFVLASGATLRQRALAAGGLCEARNGKVVFARALLREQPLEQRRLPLLQAPITVRHRRLGVRGSVGERHVTVRSRHRHVVATATVVVIHRRSRRVRDVVEDVVLDHIVGSAVYFYRHTRFSLRKVLRRRVLGVVGRLADSPQLVVVLLGRLARLDVFVQCRVLAVHHLGLYHGNVQPVLRRPPLPHTLRVVDGIRRPSPYVVVRVAITHDLAVLHEHGDAADERHLRHRVVVVERRHRVVEVSRQAARREGARLREEEEVGEAREGAAPGAEQVALHARPHQRPRAVEVAAQRLLEETPEAVEASVQQLAVQLWNVTHYVSQKLRSTRVLV